jgi:hypothetical protein
MKVKVSFKLLCLAVLAVSGVAVMAQVSGRTTLTVGSGSQPPSGTDSLLHGATVNASNQPSVAIPTGWQLAIAQGFESGSVGPNEELAFSSISTTRAHTGTHAMLETIGSNSGGNTSPGGWWTFHTTNVSCCANGEVYMSIWSYLDSNAHIDTESIFASLLTRDRTTQSLLMDTQSGAGTSANLWFSPQSNAPNQIDCTLVPGENTGQPQNCGFYGQLWNLNLGFWEQEEFWWKESTCTGGVPNNDGFFRMYINGQLVYQVDKNHSGDRQNPMGGNMNGCVDMSNHPEIDAGGIFTYFNPNPQTFNKYVDDIIVLKR